MPQGETLRISMVTRGGDIGGGDVCVLRTCRERNEQAASYTASHLLGEGMCEGVTDSQKMPQAAQRNARKGNLPTDD